MKLNRLSFNVIFKRTEITTDKFEYLKHPIILPLPPIKPALLFTTHPPPCTCGSVAKLLSWASNKVLPFSKHCYSRFIKWLLGGLTLVRMVKALRSFTAGIFKSTWLKIVPSHKNKSPNMIKLTLDQRILLEEFSYKIKNFCVRLNRRLEE